MAPRQPGRSQGPLFLSLPSFFPGTVENMNKFKDSLIQVVSTHYKHLEKWTFQRKNKWHNFYMHTVNMFLCSLPAHFYCVWKKEGGYESVKPF